jgi:type IV pilus assembly protein PilV
MKPNTHPIFSEGIRNRPRQSGFTLLEVLIALVVLAVGLLGLAGLQTFGLRYSHESYERTQANLLMYDVLDRMRANPATALTDGYNMTLSSTDTAPTATACSTTCDGNALRNYDRLRWWRMMVGDNSLAPPTPPIRGLFLTDANTQLVIARDAATNIFTVTVQWQEKDLRMRHSINARLF